MISSLDFNKSPSISARQYRETLRFSYNDLLPNRKLPNHQSVFKADLAYGYSKVSNSYWTNKSLSDSAKVILGWALSLPKDYPFSSEGICNTFNRGITSTKLLLADLEDQFYLNRDPIVIGSRRHGYAFQWFQDPRQNPRFQKMFPSDGFPSDGSPSEPSKKNSYKNKNKRTDGASAPNPAPPPSLPKNKKAKHISGMVYLTEKQHDELLESYGLEQLQWMMDKLSEWTKEQGRFKVTGAYSQLKGWVVEAWHDAQKRGDVGNEYIPEPMSDQEKEEVLEKCEPIIERMPEQFRNGIREKLKGIALPFGLHPESVCVEVQKGDLELAGAFVVSIQAQCNLDTSEFLVVGGSKLAQIAKSYDYLTQQLTKTQVLILPDFEPFLEFIQSAPTAKTVLLESLRIRRNKGYKAIVLWTKDQRKALRSIAPDLMKEIAMQKRLKC